MIDDIVGRLGWWQYAVFSSQNIIVLCNYLAAFTGCTQRKHCINSYYF